MMKKNLIRFFGFCVVGWLSLAPMRAEPILKDADLVAICGDSITEQRLYSLYIQQYLMLCQPQKNLMTTQFGWGGETAPRFLSRVDNDVLPFKPSVVTLCYGMNDGKYRPVDDPLTRRSLGAYRSSLTRTIEKLKQNDVRVIVVGSPGAVDPKNYKRPDSSAEQYNDTLAAFGATAREVAEAQGTLFADVHTVMNESMRKAKATLGEDYLIARDGVHPNPNGHLAMAYAFLKALGCDGDIGTLTLDWKNGTATGSTGHRVVSFQSGILKVESTRYPFCFSGSETDTGTRAMSAFLPFNEELNRYRLVVKNAPARVKVKWGDAEKEFTASELEAGVNLAGEFLENPFCQPFEEAGKIMARQQGQEVNLIKDILNSIRGWRKIMPETNASIDELTKAIVARIEKGRAASRAAVKPVEHQITLIPAS